MKVMVNSVNTGTNHLQTRIPPHRGTKSAQRWLFLHLTAVGYAAARLQPRLRVQTPRQQSARARDTLANSFFGTIGTRFRLIGRATFGGRDSGRS